MARLILFLAYTLLAHYSVLRDSAWAQCASLLLLAAAMLLTPLAQGRGGAWAGLAAIAAVLAALGRYSSGVGGHYLICLPSLALPLLVLFGFGRSLLPGHTPLVSAIAATVHGPLPPRLAAYTHAVTWLWTLVVAAIWLINLALLLVAPRRLWSEFANFYIYLLLGAVFFGEYAWRRWRFRDMQQPGLVEYFRLVMRRRPGLA